MALYDNKLYLLSHIRNSFILSDDTGNSELIMAGDRFQDDLRRLAKRDGTEAYLDTILEMNPPDEVEPHSFEIRLGGARDFRRRCDTEIRIEKMKRENAQRRNAPKLKVVNWKSGGPAAATLSPEEMDGLFPRKDIDSAAEPTPTTTATAPAATASATSEAETAEVGAPEKSDRVHSERLRSRSSLLSQQLANITSVPANPFGAYAKVDAKNAGPKDKIRTLRVFFGMARGRDRNYPVNAQIIGTVLVSEVIGYLCWKWTEEQRQPKLQHSNVDAYALYMSEESGEVETDFGELARSDPISKFGFPLLGLVEVEQSADDDDEAEKRQAKFVTVFYPDETFTKIELESREVKLGALVDLALSKRKNELNSRISHTYGLERTDAPGVALDETTLLSSLPADQRQFHLVRANAASRRARHSVEVRVDAGGGTDATADDDGDAAAITQVTEWEARLYQQFDNVAVLTDFRTKVPVFLEVSEEKLEIYPKRQVHSAKFWAKQTAAAYNMAGVVACDVVDSKSSGHWMFNVVYHTDHGYKKLRFESEESTAKKIHSKVNILLDWHASDVRKEYTAHKEKKLQRRQSWHASFR